MVYHAVYSFAPSEMTGLHEWHGTGDGSEVYGGVLSARDCYLQTRQQAAEVCISAGSALGSETTVAYKPFYV